MLDLLVPKNGEEANTIQGRLIQAITILASDYRRNGSAHWEGTFVAGGHNSRNHALGYHRWGNFLLQHLHNETIFDHEALKQIEQDSELMKKHGEKGCEFDYTDGKDVYDRMTDRVVEFCRACPELEWISQKQNQPATSIAHIFE